MPTLASVSSSSDCSSSSSTILSTCDVGSQGHRSGLYQILGGPFLSTISTPSAVVSRIALPSCLSHLSLALLVPSHTQIARISLSVSLSSSNALKSFRCAEKRESRLRWGGNV